MYTGERDLTEVVRSTTPHGFYYHIIDKRTKKTWGVIREGYYFPRCVRWREIAGLPRKKGCEVDCGRYRVILNSGVAQASPGLVLI